MIKREQYLRPIRACYDRDLIKIITGIRHCGNRSSSDRSPGRSGNIQTT